MCRKTSRGLIFWNLIFLATCSQSIIFVSSRLFFLHFQLPSKKDYCARGAVNEIRDKVCVNRRLLSGCSGVGDLNERGVLLKGRMIKVEFIRFYASFIMTARSFVILASPFFAWCWRVGWIFFIALRKPLERRKREDWWSLVAFMLCPFIRIAASTAKTSKA